MAGLRHYAAMTAACVIWGISFVMTKHALSALPPMALVFARFALSAIMMVLISPLLHFQRIPRSDLKLFIVLCLFEPGLYYVFETVGISRTDATSAALIISSIPVLVIVFAHFTTGERLTAAKVAGAIVSIAGVVVVTSGGAASHGGQTTIAGNAFVLLAAVTAACFTILLSRLAQRYNPVTVTRFQVFFAAVFFAPLGVPGLLETGVSAFGATHFAALAYLAVFSGVGAFFLYNFGLTKIEAGRASVFINLIPVFTAISAWIFLGEAFTLIHLLGGALTIGGVLIANVPSRGTSITEQF